MITYRRLKLLVATALIAMAFPGLAKALTLGTSNDGTWTYVFTIPSLVEGGATTVTMVIEGDPIGGNSNTLMSYSANGTPFDEEGAYLCDLSWTGTVDSSSMWTVEELFEFYNGDGTYADFSFSAPLSYWSETGSGTFPTSSTDTVYTLEWHDPSNTLPEVWGTEAVGANYLEFDGSGNLLGDPVCTDCALTVTFEPATVTPEPASLMLFSSGGAAMLPFFWRRLRRRRA